MTPREPGPPTSNRGRDGVRFIIDGMLGGVARKLRLLGFNTIFLRDTSDSRVLEMARPGGTDILVTRDKELYLRAKKRGVRAVYADDDELATIAVLLKLVGVESVTIDPERARCTFCNTPITKVGRGSVRGLVPDKVYERHRDFYVCRGCGRVYWKGNQWKNIKSIEARINVLIRVGREARH